jgi:hypothetical protein
MTHSEHYSRIVSRIDATPRRTLALVTGKLFYCRCLDCGSLLLAGDGPHTVRVYADCNGAAFLAYYCAPCAAPRQPW